MTLPSTGHHVLVFGDDGSDSSTAAWEWICSHSWSGWDLVCVHAEAPEVVRVSDDPEAERPKPWVPADPYRRLPPSEAGFASVAYKLAECDPRIAFYRLEEITLLVIGAGRAPRPLSALLGSTARYLLADPPAPLVLAKHSKPVQRVVAAVDGSESSAAAIRAFGELPLAAEADVEVVSVDTGDRRFHDDAIARAARLLSEACGSARISTRLLQGSPRKALLDYLSSLDPPADLVVAGTRGHSTLPRPHVGSVTYALVEKGDVNLLVAREHS